MLLLTGSAPQDASASKKPQRSTTDCNPVSSGGINADAGECYSYANARLKVTKRDGKVVDREAIAPDSAPPEIKRVINRANKIRKKPYVWGGGRGKKWFKKVDRRGYDCSGAVSFAIRGLGAKYLKSPLTSGGFLKWGEGGKGQWITVWTHSGHVWLEVAGLRFDTSGTGGKGPRWVAEEGPKKKPFKPRFLEGF